MVKEAYVSFETAKLLKEKGFDWGCYKVYNDKGIISEQFINEEIPFNYQDCDYRYMCPSLSVAMRWLREVHSLHITIKVYGTPNGIVYAYEICKLEQHAASLLKSKSGFENNENACEEAIKYCLENFLIMTKEDENIREEIIRFLINFNNGCYTRPSETDIADWVSWLEKQYI